jgi:hypothetical protein
VISVVYLRSAEVTWLESEEKMGQDLALDVDSLFK